MNQAVHTVRVHGLLRQEAIIICTGLRVKPILIFSKHREHFWNDGDLLS